MPHDRHVVTGARCGSERSEWSHSLAHRGAAAAPALAITAPVGDPGRSIPALATKGLLTPHLSRDTLLAERHPSMGKLSRLSGLILGVIFGGVGCSSNAPMQVSEGPHSFCGDGVLDPGEVCEPGIPDGNTCEHYCRSSCGNGVVEPFEVCDDGNIKDGDSCAHDCSQACGNGTLEEPESCDDGNLEPGDGCYACRNAGGELWNSPGTCIGAVMSYGENALRVLCTLTFDTDRGHLYRTFSLDGRAMEADPPSLSDPAELEVTPKNMVQLASGEMYVTTAVQRNLLPGPTSQVRTRVYRLAADGSPLWQTDLTDFPGGRWDRPLSAAALGNRLVVVVSSTGNPNSVPDGQSYIALVGDDGKRAWKVSFEKPSVALRVVTRGDDTVFVAGLLQNDLNLWAFNAQGELLWRWNRGLSPDTITNFEDLRLSGDVLTILSRQLNSTDLVPIPPRVTADWSIDSIDANTGKAAPARLVNSIVTDGKDLKSVAPDLPLATFSQLDGIDYYLMGHAGGQAFRADASPVWTTNVPIPGAVVFGSLVRPHLLCVSAFSDLTPNLACYLTD